MNRSFLLFSAAVALATGAYLALNPSTQAAPKLLPFQGRLTDASGDPIGDGPKVVQFKIYDAPTGGTAVWNGEVQKVTVNGGLVSTLLGSKADLTNVDFNQPLYLEITVDANADSQITASDPPLLPRQSILPAVFAVSAESAAKMSVLDAQGKPISGQAYGWASVFNNGNPATGRIDASKLADGTITGAQVADSSIGRSKLVGTTQDSLVAPGTILAYGGPGGPSGYFPCDGAAYSRTDHPILYGIIGTSFGAPDGNTFNVPDLRGVFLRGVDGVRGRDPDANSRFPLNTGGNPGNAVGSLQGHQIASHAHSLGGDGQGGDYKQDYALTPSGNGTAIRVPTQGTSATILNTGRTSPTGGFETRPINVYVNYIIKY